MQPSLRTDSGIERLIRARLADPEASCIRELGVLAVAGQVRLFGEAPSYAEKRRAGQITAGIEGVKRVINQLRIIPD